MLHTARINSSSNSNRGFTVVELVVGIVIIAVMFPLFTFILNMYHDAHYLDEKNKMSSEAAQALWYIEDSIRISNAFMTHVPSNFQDNYGPNNLGTDGGQAWSYKGTSATNRVLITRNYATTANPLNSGRQPVFVNSGTFNCTTEMFYQPQLTYIAIYFVRNNTLYYRVLTDKTTALCPGNTQQQKLSCPPEITSGRHASCDTNDEILATNVSDFSVKYYRIVQNAADEQLDPSYTSTDPDVLLSADYAEVTLSESVRQGAITITLMQRMTKVNQ